MAQLMTVRLARDGGNPWGFRLQGGKDFGTPLLIQKVNGGSPAEKAGLIAGDSVIKVNTTDVFNLRHKDAQDVIVKAGQTFEMTVQRGGSTWKPAVNPVGSLPRSTPIANNVSPVTQTSLAAKKQDFVPIGAAHNMSPKGFNQPHMNGDGPKLVNKQYNSPMGLYSEESIAETLSAQAEVLSTGAMGVNFKKNEKKYNSEKSEVLKMLQESENEPRSPEPALEPHQHQTIVAPPNSGVVSAPVPAALAAVSPAAGVAGLRRVAAPENKPAPATPQLPPGQNICADCERLIVGVFVRIKDKNLHVECFKCATCGQSLKNVGYYNINNKLYCDIHAKLAAMAKPPAPNMVPVAVPPGGKLPAGTISAALSQHSLPTPSPMSPSANPLPAPFQLQKQDTVDSYTPNSYSANNNLRLRKEDAVVNLMSALTLASKIELKENGTNTDPIYLTEKIIPINNDANDDQYPCAKIKYMPYRPKTGTSLSGPKPFSSVQPSLPTHGHAPFASVQPSTPTYAPPAQSNTLPRAAAPAATMPGLNISTVKPTPSSKEHANDELNIKSNGNTPDTEILMCPVSSEMYIPLTEYDISPKFNSIDLRVPVHVVKDKTNSPDQEVFQINASRSYDNSPVQFDGNLRNFVQSQLDNGKPILNNNDTCKSLETHFMPVVETVLTNNNIVDTNGVNPPNLKDLGLVEGEHPICVDCNKEIKRGPFITALGKIWCPDHFVCTTPTCKRPLQDMGFVEERGCLYCELCFEQYLAPVCSKCNTKIKGDCLNAIGKHFHPECFTCAYCSKLFGNSPFFLEDGLPYCEADWNELFTTKCFACGFPVEAGDRWVEALSNNYHSQCFNCTMCKKNLEGQSFYAKGGRPFCKNHAR